MDTLSVETSPVLSSLVLPLLLYIAEEDETRLASVVTCRGR
jgi:hypothetical protein